MGEKIRDLNTIKVGKSEFMIELNEGYTTEGRVIHVQNNKFRYLFREQQFIKLCANFMRAKSELDYLRSHRITKLSSKKNDIVSVEASSDTKSGVVQELSLLLDSENIRFKFVEIRNFYISIIVFPDDNTLLDNLSKKEKHSLIKLNHPYGKMFGYSFLYQMKEFQLYYFKNAFLQVFFQLPCMSLENNTWIPLDRSIQSSVWNRTSTTDNKMLNNECLFIYKLCLCVFQFKNFADEHILFLSNLFLSLDVSYLEEMLNYVFFSYTSRMMDLIRQNKYDKIINDYYSFNCY